MTAPVNGNGGIASILPAAAPRPATADGSPPSGGVPAPRGGSSFAEQLRRSTGGIQFSKHALARVERRGIETSPATLSRLRAGVDRAAGKGSRDAVVLVDDTAFVVSVRNRTVITAVGARQMREHVFTNIDSAVIA